MSTHSPSGDGPLTVSIDRSLCSGHGRCYSMSPEIFDADDEGFPLLEVEQVEPGSEAAEAAQLGVDVCPEGAISLVPR